MLISSLKVALIHDWLHTHRGGEKILEALCEIFPSAPIFTLFYSPGRCSPLIERHPIHTSFLNRLPGNRKYYRYLLPLFPLAAEKLHILDYDLIFSSSHCVAKGVIPSPGATHISYCHTPMRYAWDRYQDYFGKSWAEWAFLPFLHQLRIWDSVSSNRVDHFIANSYWVKQRIQKYYRRESRVITPFVDLDFFQPKIKSKEDFYLIVSSFVPYKRLDIAIQACRNLGKRLILVGEGPEESKLRSLSGPGIEFAGRVEFSQLRDLYCRARALLFPGEEDFGIAPLEAMACGTPILAFARGGVTETVVEKETGLFFFEQTSPSLEKVISEFESSPSDFWVDACRARAEKFSKKIFQQKITDFVLSHAVSGNSRALLHTPEGLT